MPDYKRSVSHSTIEAGVEEIRLESDQRSKEWGGTRIHDLQRKPTSHNSPSRTGVDMKSTSQSPVKNGHMSGDTTPGTDHHEEVVAGEVAVSIESGYPPKLVRSVSQKIVARSPPLFTDHADKSTEAQKHFEMIPACTYSNKYIGSTEHGMDCDCVEEWGKTIAVYMYRST